jgi:hypothetical protein
MAITDLGVQVARVLLQEIVGSKEIKQTVVDTLGINL